VLQPTIRCLGRHGAPRLEEVAEHRSTHPQPLRAEEGRNPARPIRSVVGEQQHGGSIQALALGYGHELADDASGILLRRDPQGHLVHYSGSECVEGGVVDGLQLGAPCWPCSLEPCCRRDRFQNPARGGSSWRVAGQGR
jgi:hypothetical protein